MSSPVTVVIVGCGSRGQVYARYSLEHPEKCRVVGIAEPRNFTRMMMAEKYNILSENVFVDWKDIKEKIADAIVICTQDKMHAEPAIWFANMGYHILLEKPMAPTENQCRDIHAAVSGKGIIFAIGHVLRYTPYSLKLKSLLESGLIGDIVNIQHLEPVGYWHFAHSFVRGNWRKESESSCALLAKSCHDIDWILWMMNKECLKVSSFGSLKHFKKEEKPPGAGERCLSCGIEESCPYSAKKIYLEPAKAGHCGWPVSIVSENPTVENITEALSVGPYGRCVYGCDNDVVDNQVVNMYFDGGGTASFTMMAFTENICVRNTRIFGTKGELEGDGETNIKIFDFTTKKTTVYRPDPSPKTSLNAHGGGDYYLMKSFVEAVSTKDPSKISSIDSTLKSHLVVFAAEKARLGDCVCKLSW